MVRLGDYYGPEPRRLYEPIQKLSTNPMGNQKVLI
jgi:hypothetical protein